MAPTFLEDHDCGDLFPADDALDCRKRWRALHQWRSTAAYNALRYEQLLDGKFDFLVYRTGHLDGCPEHDSWSGFAAPSDHPIWKTHFPANSWFCNCRLSGARSLRGIERLGGNPLKDLPPAWEKIDVITGLPVGIEPGFGTHVFPDLVACLRALEDGHHRRLTWA